MGEVYRARDTKLKRDVALKILGGAFTIDTDRLARFQREAEILASLNHPHIAAIHGLEDADGVAALVLELVEGPTLAERIGRGRIPVEEALAIALQIADAVEAAHDVGVIHRDLKPANIKIRSDGIVKVLDFGLARSVGGAAENAGTTNTPTITTPAMTAAGLVLGTAAYMSPEQAKGRAVDKRADVWAFGAVLFEMLTGRRAFEGDDVQETMAAVLRATPTWSALPPETPPAIRRLLRRSLEKDPRARLSDMAMVRVELREAQAEPSQDEAATKAARPAARSAFGRVAPYATAIALALLTGFLVWRFNQPADVPQPIVRFSIELPDDGRLSPAQRNPLAISRDGTHVVYTSDQRLFLRALDQVASIPVPGTEAGGGDGHARAPFFSPDGQWIGFWQQRQVKKAPIGGGAVVPICDWPYSTPPYGASWAPDGEILLGAGVSGVVRAPAAGGRAEPLIALKDGERAAAPRALPGGEWIVFVLHPASVGIDQGKVVAQSRKTGERRVLIEGARDVWLVPGRLIYAQGNALRSRAFDAGRVLVSDGLDSVLEGVGTGQNPGAVQAAIAANGSLIYNPGAGSGATTLTRLVLVTRDGAPSTLAEVSGMAWFPRFSPDGSRVAYGASAGRDFNDASDLWVVDSRGARTRVTFGANNRFYPIWTRDGARLTFADGTGPTNRLLWAPADGSGGLETLLEVGERRYPTSWSPDGRVLALYGGGGAAGEVRPDGGSSRDLWMLHVEGDKRVAKPFVQTSFEERGAIFSPDGRWVAYVSNKAGQNDVYARPYPGPGGEVTISVGGGREPVWAPSGRELFYRREGKLLSVRIESSAMTMTVGAPAPVFDDPYRLDTGAAAGGVANYDIAPDGKRFVMVEEPQASPAGGRDPVRLQVILNWLGGPERRGTTNAR
jgi:serine/threonine-protein kinase